MKVAEASSGVDTPALKILSIRIMENPHLGRYQHKSHTARGNTQHHLHEVPVETPARVELAVALDDEARVQVGRGHVEHEALVALHGLVAQVFDDDLGRLGARDANGLGPGLGRVRVLQPDSGLPRGLDLDAP